MTKIKLPLGIDNFEKLRTSGCYYMDKTGFIRELLDETFEVNLITRPRRFGKTLTMSMLSEFLDIRKDSSRLFEGLEIVEDAEFCEKWMNQWPVLLLTLKDVNGKNFEGAYGILQFVISSLCVEHSYLKNSSRVDEDDKVRFARLKSSSGTMIDIKTSLVVLTRMMEAHYGKKVILLVDEYDVPLAKASDYGYYDDMLDVVRSLLGMVWKTNPSLKCAVVTGCLRIAKESIFTGANNFVSRSISGKRYNRYFGFFETEVSKLLSDAGFSDHLPEMKKWYDGYQFGGKEVYCPWDVINHVNELLVDVHAPMGNYWRDTSHNNIIRKFIDSKNMAVCEKFETLLAGGVIQERIVEDLTYDFDHSTEENLWSILYLTGYLTQVNPKTLPEGMRIAAGNTALRIPNEEVKTIFAETVAKWFTDSIEAKDRSQFFTAWWNADEAVLTKEISDILFDTISYFDYKEDYYHAFVAGLFSGAGYEVSSNSEQGTGRADVVVKDRKNRRAIVVEMKRSPTENGLEKYCDKALQQIEQRQYAEQLRMKGFETVLCYGAAFFAKKCLIKCTVKRE